MLNSLPRKMQGVYYSILSHMVEKIWNGPKPVINRACCFQILGWEVEI